jgi:hypothetical protein
LNHNSQNQIHKLNVTFAYRRWHPVHSKFVGKNIYPNVNNGIDEIQNRTNYYENVQQDKLYDIKLAQQPVPGRPRGGQ